MYFFTQNIILTLLIVEANQPIYTLYIFWFNPPFCKSVKTNLIPILKKYILFSQNILLQLHVEIAW